MSGPVLVIVSVLATLIVTIVVINLSSGEKKIEAEIEPVYGVEDPQFVRAMGSLLGPPLVSGNNARELLNGDRIFPSMLEAISGARRTICFETFIYWSGDVGRRFTEALVERARAGVRIHLLLDWLGSVKMDEVLLDEMRRAGVQIERYHPIRWYSLSRVNNRTHRKLLIVDGRIGFTGGVGIADQWLGDAGSSEEWRDTHFRVEGPAVAHMQAAFMDNWLKTHATVLHGDDYFPPLEEAGPMLGQVFKSSPGEGAESMRLMYLLSVACARRSIRIANAYFVPDDLSVRTLVAARERGVAVQIITPGYVSDAKIVHKASRARWGPLLQAGAEIYEFQDTMYHCKVLVVDDLWVSVGSTNFDNRSFRLNDEANLNLLDGAFARALGATFERDRERSHRVTWSEWHARPFWEKAQEHLAALLRAQL